MVSRSDIFYDLYRKCDLPIFVGELPRDLRERVGRSEIADATRRFDAAIESFISDNYKKLTRQGTNLVYELPEIGRIFGTRCVAECDNTLWSGSFGNVLRLTFDGVSQKYALKIFRGAGLYHGAAYEIPTAFSATHAEPRDNVRVHMATVRGRSLRARYMLSDWCDVDGCGPCRRDNKNEIFQTSLDEVDPRNYVFGRRLDYGRTFMTEYGRASYRVRKMYRQIADMAARDDIDGLRQMIAKNDSYVARSDMVAAFAIADKKIRRPGVVMDMVRTELSR